MRKITKNIHGKKSAVLRLIERSMKAQRGPLSCPFFDEKEIIYSNSIEVTSSVNC
jgi:hypothetical protein